MKPYKYKDCAKTVSQHSNLTKHMRTPSGEKPYSCKECDRAFRQRSYVTIHMRTHTREKPCNCKECGKTFSVSNSLTKHMRTHTKEKPYNCKECGKTFSVIYNLATHMRTHTGEKPYSCKECGEKPYSCKECGKTFSVSGSLATHDENPHRREAIQFRRSHGNVAVVYYVDIISSIPMLGMEKVETSLSSLLCDVGDRVSVRERVDLAFGIVCAVKYFHDQLRVSHGLISCDTVFVTQQLNAKMLDPSAAFLLTGKLVPESRAGDIKQTTEILLSLLSDTCPSFLLACDRLRDIAADVERVERKGDCNSLSEMKDLLDSLQQTTEYRRCPRGRQLVCESLGE